MFLIGKGAESEVESGWYEFEPYHYGPFCPDIYEDAESLESDGLVMRVPSRAGRWTDTLITYDGMVRAEGIKEESPRPHCQLHSRRSRLDRTLTIPGFS